MQDDLCACTQRRQPKVPLPALLPLLLACLVAVSPSGATAQLLGVALTNTTLVLTSGGFADAIKDNAITEILINSNVKLEERDFRPTPVLQRNLTIAAQTGAAEATVDFQEGLSLLLAGTGSALTFRDVALINIPAAAKGDASGDNVVPTFALWPAVYAEPNATLAFRNTTIEYRISVDYNTCEQYQVRVIQQLQQVFGDVVEILTPIKIFLRGRTDSPTQVTSNQIVIGSVNVSGLDTTLVCSLGLNKGGRHFPWWAGLIIGLGVILLLAAAALIILALCLRRYKRQASSSGRNDEESNKDMDTPAGTGNTATGWTPESQPGAPGSNPGSTVGPLAGGGGGGGPSNLTALLTGMQSSSQHGREITEYHSNLLAMRLQSGLEGVEVGPQLGRGSYGCVYKGRWQGAMVAIKVVESDLAGTGADDATRESLLSASIAHPNVIACYKICAVRTTQPGGSGTISERTASPPDPQLSRELTDADIAAAKAAPGVRADSVPQAPVETSEQLARVAASQRQAKRASGSTAMDSGGAAELKRPSESSQQTATTGGIQLEVLGTGSDGKGSQETGTIETWMLLEYADRGSLEQAIQARRFYRRHDQILDLVSIYRTLLDIALGMSYLHSLGIVHGDLKPANVLLKSTVTDARGFTCKLADFGLSRTLGTRSALSAAALGTVTYMPPEMLTYNRLTKFVDVYSLGIIMWQLYTGATPFKNMSMPAVLIQVVQENARPEVPADMPASYRSLMERCWDADPTERPTFDQLLAELAVQAKEVAAESARGATPPPAPSASRRSPSFSLRDFLPKKKSSSSDSEGGRAGSSKRSGNSNGSSSKSRRSSGSPDLEDSALGSAAAAAAAAAAAVARGTPASSASATPVEQPQASIRDSAESRRYPPPSPQASTDAPTEASLAASELPPSPFERVPAQRQPSAHDAAAASATPPQQLPASSAPMSESALSDLSEVSLGGGMGANQLSPAGSELAGGGSISFGARSSRGSTGSIGGGGSVGGGSAGSNIAREAAAASALAQVQTEGKQQPLPAVREEMSRGMSSGSSSMQRSQSELLPDAAGFKFAAQGDELTGGGGATSSAAWLTSAYSAQLPEAAGAGDAQGAAATAAGPEERFRMIRARGSAQGGALRYSLEGRRPRRFVSQSADHPAADASGSRSPSPGSQQQNFALGSGVVRPHAGAGAPVSASTGTGAIPTLLQPSPDELQRQRRRSEEQERRRSQEQQHHQQQQQQQVPSPFAAAAARRSAELPPSTIRDDVTSGFRASLPPPPEAAAAGLPIHVPGANGGNFGAAADAAVQAVQSEQGLREAASLALAEARAHGEPQPQPPSDASGWS